MEISTIGLDLAKNVLQVHGVSATGEVVVRKTLRRSQLLSGRCFGARNGNVWAHFLLGRFLH